MKASKKIKTSISLRPETLEKLQEIAAADDRSVSYLLEKFAEKLVLAEESGKAQSPGAAPAAGGFASNLVEPHKLPTPQPDLKKRQHHAK